MNPEPGSDLHEDPTLETPPEDPTLEHPTVEEERENGNPAEPASVFDELREAYQESNEERRITIAIAPGRFSGNLAARYKPGPWSDYRKRAERAFRRGGSEEAELQFASATIVQCCETILYRPADSSELMPMADSNPAWRGGEPVRYDERLASAIGIDPIPGHAQAICRLVFKNPAALNDHFVTLDAWLKESIASDDEEEGELPPT
jgi:hypothetical protein